MNTMMTTNTNEDCWEHYRVKTPRDDLPLPSSLPRIVCILPNKLYLGNLVTVRYPAQELKNAFNVTACVTVSHDPSRGDLPTYRFPMVDGHFQMENFNRWIFKVADCIHHLIQQGHKVVVHCSAGINRAPACVVAYLMLFEKYTYAKAFNHVKYCKRKDHHYDWSTLDNICFRTFLMQLDENLRKGSSDYSVATSIEVDTIVE